MTPEQAQTLVGREFVHFKGKRYRLVAVAKHSETLEPIVVYRALYGEGGVWVRPFAMFFEDVDRDGYRGPRFRLAEDIADGAATGDAEAADASGPARTLPSPAGRSWRDRVQDGPRLSRSKYRSRVSAPSSDLESGANPCLK